MRCRKCGGKVTEIPMKNSDGVKGHCYFCNQCHNNFWKPIDGTIIDSSKDFRSRPERKRGKKK